MTMIEKGHLERAAYIYVRQSSLSQVEHNLESQRRQYALVERAKELGWQEIRVVDEDMGCSGSGHVTRLEGTTTPTNLRLLLKTNWLPRA